MSLRLGESSEFTQPWAHLTSKLCVSPRIWRWADEKTIKLKPLTNLTKKRNHLVQLHHHNSKNKLLPIKSGCKVL